MKYIKIFDRSHTLLGEINEFSSLKYSWTLNGMGKASFSVPLESPKSTATNYSFRTHVEVWDDEVYIWGGQIVSREFDDSKLNISCYGYLSLLDKRRLKAKAYANMTYGELFTAMLADINVVEASGVTLGTVATGSLKTQRTVTAKDMLLKKLQDYCSDANYDMEVGEGRLFNFYLRKGSVKSNYKLEFGGDADNILLAPTLSQDVMNIANSVYTEATNGGVTIESTAEDSTSKALYGIQEEVLSANDSVVLQSTLDGQAAAELQRVAYPVNGLSLTIKDSALCPFNDIVVGDSIPISLRPYWGYTDTLRILEMEHDESTGNRTLTVGETLYRQQKPVIKIYS